MNIKHVFNLILCLLSSTLAFSQDAASLKGSWHVEQGSTNHLLIFADGYYTYTAYDKELKQVSNSSGGRYEVKDKQIVTSTEFNSAQPEEVGKTANFPFSISGKMLTLEVNGSPVPMENIDDGNGALSGAWRITGRMQDGKRTEMAGGARKTIKIMSGSRFHWFAINPETKEFFGTGGGTYSFENGKYTETIDFFPKDSSRVGMSLTFDDKVQNGEWHHTGKSSKGDPIYEIWTKIKP